MTDAAQRIYEQLLVTRCQAGDDAAFAELVGLYHRRIAYFVRRLMGDGSPTEDLMQEVWLAAFRGLPRLRDPGALPVWLYRIAHDKACRELRRRRQWIELDDASAAVEAPDRGPDFTPQQAAAIHRCLRRLAPAHREVLVLRFLEDLTYEQMAEVVGCPVGTVRSRLYHAKSALRRHMEETHGC
jgi:RNA polymerase sigma-70 factor (ECF subfamily)